MLSDSGVELTAPPHSQLLRTDGSMETFFDWGLMREVYLTGKKTK